MMLNLVRPRYFMPVHGEYRHQHIHRGLARESGIPEEDIFILENGDVLEIDGDNAELVDKVPTGMVFVDGFEIGDAEGLVLRDRQQLAGDGIIIAVVTVDAQSGETVAPPELVARGFLHDDERLKGMLEECGVALDKLMAELGADQVTGQKLIREDINQRLSELVFQRTQAPAAHHARRRRGLRPGANRPGAGAHSPGARDSPPGVEQLPMATARPKQARRRAGAASGTRTRSAAAPPRPGPSPGRRPRPPGTAVSSRRSPAWRSPSSWASCSTSAGTAVRAGRWLGDVARWLVGILAFALPFLLGFLAYLLVVKEESRPRRGMSWGIAFIVAGVALAAAADAFGIFSGERPDALFRDAYMSAHGGVLGEIQWAVLSPFIGRVGVDVLVIALLVAGVLLVTGSSLRQWATHSKQGVAKAGRAARSQAESLGARRREASDTRDRGALRVADRRRRRPHAHLHHRRPRRRNSTSRRPLPAAGPHLIDGVSEAPEIFGEADAAARRAGSRADRGGGRRRAALARRRGRGGGREGRGGRRGRGARLRRRRAAPVVACRTRRSCAASRRATESLRRPSPASPSAWCPRWRASTSRPR